MLTDPYRLIRSESRPYLSFGFSYSDITSFSSYVARVADEDAFSKLHLGTYPPGRAALLEPLLGGHKPPLQEGGGCERKINQAFEK